MFPLLVALSVTIPAAAQQDTVRFTPSVGHPTFAVREPVLRINPGTVLISETNRGAYYEPGGGAFREAMTGTTTLPDSRVREITIQLRPMLGRLAVAPRGEEAYNGLWPGDFGGNMDAPEMREGTTVYLPIFHEGAYFYFGDGHARQGEGEVNGTGLETSMDVTLRIDLIKGKTIDWPRFEDENYIMVAGSARPLIDAFRLAHVELVEWLEADYGFGKWDAYMLVGQLGESTVANIVDPIYTVVAKFPKEHLPPPQ